MHFPPPRLREFLPALLFLFMGFPLFSQHEFYFRLNPAAVIPLGEENIRTGAGVEASFDWAFLHVPKNAGLGLSLSGAYSGLSSGEGTALTFLEAGLGAFYQWRFNDRFSFRGALTGGLYHYRWDTYQSVFPKFGVDVSGAFHILPFLSIYAQGGYTLYSLSPAPPLNGLSLGAGVSLNLGELFRPASRVQGEKVEQQRVFPVSYAWYEDNGIARIRIVNGEPNAITDVTISFYLEQFMNQETAFARLSRLESGEEAEYAVTALFNESMLELTENTIANARITVRYRSLGLWKTAGFSVQMPVFHRNAMSWDDDRRAASFVSARDPAAVYFARFVESSIRRNLRDDVPGNIQIASALFEALSLYGIRYVIDPSSSYVELSGDASALDSLYYPYQTLMFRGGDCDDLSILFCSLLEVLGIETAFITIPGHIYCAFALDEPADGGVSGGIISGGRRWIPVEITIPQRDFAEALRLGLRQWQNAGDQARLYPMDESWKIYPPVSVPGSGDRLPEMPSAGDILLRWQESLKKLGKF